MPEPKSLSIEERLARLEGKVGWHAEETALRRNYLLLSAALGLAALATALLGLGLPNHYYQVILGILFVILLYHQNLLAYPQAAAAWGIAILNAANASVLFKLLIGGGLRYPGWWLMYPRFNAPPGEDEAAWYDLVPKLSLEWQKSAAADWSIDLTIIQTFLLVITLSGALFDFQPFISLTAFLLILISIPALVGFDWSFVFPAMILTALSFYLQSAENNRD